MLKPAILYRDEIFAKLLEYSYTDNMLFYMGCLGNELPKIEENSSGNVYQYAIIGEDNKLIGYFAYSIDWYSSCVYNFGLFAFDRNNTTIGFDVYKELKKIINDYHIHRMEWRMIQGNPVEGHYDNSVSYTHLFSGRCGKATVGRISLRSIVYSSSYTASSSAVYSTGVP